MKRSNFIKFSTLSTLGLSLSPSLAFSELLKDKELFFKISLAQWSLHRTIQSGTLDPIDFPIKARKDFNIGAVEYVNQFFMDKAKDKKWLTELKNKSIDHDVKNLLIMIDNEGHLANNRDQERTKAVENHYKWVEAAQFLGCHSIRVNLHGDSDEQEWKEASVKSLSQLSTFAADYDINVIVENHGQWSSKGKLVADVIQKVDSKNCGTLPDFGNFCFRRRDGDLWESPCEEWYNRYQGVDEMMPFAFDVSAKTFDFDKDGNDTATDFHKMLSIVKKHNFKGYIGIEYEGGNTNEDQGIRNTITLLNKVGAKLSSK